MVTTEPIVRKQIGTGGFYLNWLRGAPLSCLLPRTVRLLFILCNRADRRTASCWPSMQLCLQDGKMCPHSFWRARSDLVAAGIIAYSEDARSSRTTYYLARNGPYDFSVKTNGPEFEKYRKALAQNKKPASPKRRSKKKKSRTNSEAVHNELGSSSERTGKQLKKIGFIVTQIEQKMVMVGGEAVQEAVKKPLQQVLATLAPGARSGNQEGQTTTGLRIKDHTPAPAAADLLAAGDVFEVSDPSDSVRGNRKSDASDRAPLDLFEPEPAWQVTGTNGRVLVADPAPATPAAAAAARHGAGGAPPNDTGPLAAAKRRGRPLEEGGEPQQLLAAYCAAFQAKFQDPPTVEFAKDLKLAKKLVATYGLKRAQELVAAFFASRDQFVLESGYTWGCLYSQVNKLIVQTLKRKDKYQPTFKPGVRYSEYREGGETIWKELGPEGKLIERREQTMEGM